MRFEKIENFIKNFAKSRFFSSFGVPHSVLSVVSYYAKGTDVALEPDWVPIDMRPDYNCNGIPDFTEKKYINKW